MSPPAQPRGRGAVHRCVHRGVQTLPEAGRRRRPCQACTTFISRSTEPIFAGKLSVPCKMAAAQWPLSPETFLTGRNCFRARVRVCGRSSRELLLHACTKPTRAQPPAAPHERINVTFEVFPVSKLLCGLKNFHTHGQRAQETDRSSPSPLESTRQNSGSSK